MAPFRLEVIVLLRRLEALSIPHNTEQVLFELVGKLSFKLLEKVQEEFDSVQKMKQLVKEGRDDYVAPAEPEPEKQLNTDQFLESIQAVV